MLQEEGLLGLLWTVDRLETLLVTSEETLKLKAVLEIPSS
jgi:hypothetical protein